MRGQWMNAGSKADVTQASLGSSPILLHILYSQNALPWPCCLKVLKFWSLLLWTNTELLFLQRSEIVFMALVCPISRFTWVLRCFQCHLSYQSMITYSVLWYIITQATIQLKEFIAMFCNSIPCVNPSYLKFRNSMDKYETANATMNSRI